MQQKIIWAVATLTLTASIAMSSLAETTAEDAADYRIAVMTSLRGHMVAASMIVRGLVEDNGYLVKHAEGLENGLREAHRVFQEGSNVGESAALPAIWQNTEDFASSLKKAEEASSAFTKAAASGDAAAIGGAFRDVGQSCRGCHDEFKQSDD